VNPRPSSLAALREFLRGPDFSYELRRSAAAFGILILLAFGGGFLLPELRDQIVETMTVQVSTIAGADGSLSPFSLLGNNLTACAVSILYGLLPFVYLPALALGVNAVILGVLAAYYMTHGYSLALYLAALLPHGIFELPALVLAFAAGLYLCGDLTRRCRRQQTAPFALTAANLSRVYLLLITPLLAAAAVAEAYVTPRVLSLFF
jgi:stage II sporulation protein M